jgi:hypothetical protein
MKFVVYLSSRSKWIDDEDNIMYFDWHHQGLADASLYKVSGVHQPFQLFCEQILERFNATTCGEARSISSIMHRWEILVTCSHA